MRGSTVIACSRRISAAVLVAAALVAGPVDAAGLAKSETVFPDTTLAWLSVPDPQEFRARFDRSPYGQLIADPAMKAFVDGIKEQVSKNGKQRLAKLGLTLEDLAEVVGGEIAAASIKPADGRLATVLVVDTTGREEKARALVERLGARLLERKAKTVTVPGAPPGWETRTSVEVRACARSYGQTRRTCAHW